MNTDLHSKIDRVIFFDGVCGLCNGFVDFLIRVDKEQKFLFCSLQSEKAKVFFKSNNLNKLNYSKSQNELENNFRNENLNELNFSTVVYFKNEKFFTKSQAIKEIFNDLGGFFKILSIVLNIFPIFVLNKIYDFISKKRYKVFGKRDVCRVPSLNEKNRFIE